MRVASLVRAGALVSVQSCEVGVLMPVFRGGVLMPAPKGWLEASLQCLCLCAYVCTTSCSACEKSALHQAISFAAIPLYCLSVMQLTCACSTWFVLQQTVLFFDPSLHFGHVSYYMTNHCCE